MAHHAVVACAIFCMLMQMGLVTVEAQEFDVCIITKIRIFDQLFTCNLIEWIEYHRLIGVDHIFINDDCSGKDAAVNEALSYYVNAGIVTLRPLPLDGSSCEGYVFKEKEVQQDAVDTYKHRCKYIGMSDFDEFVSFQHYDRNRPNKGYGLEGSYKEYINEMKDKRCMTMPWFIVGSDGYDRRPSGLVTETYKYGGNVEFSRDYNLKSMVQSDLVSEWTSPHHPSLTMSLKGCISHDLLQEMYSLYELHDSGGIFVKVPSPDKEVFLYHYRYYSWQEYATSRARYSAKKGVFSNAEVDFSSEKDDWALGNSSAENAVTIGREFMEDMSALVKKTLLSTGERRKAFGKQCKDVWGLH